MRSSFTVFAHESLPRSARFEAENRLYLFALTVPTPSEEMFELRAFNSVTATSAPACATPTSL
jgi:hypothetical protein